MRSLPFKIIFFSSFLPQLIVLTNAVLKYQPRQIMPSCNINYNLNETPVHLCTSHPWSGIKLGGNGILGDGRDVFWRRRFLFVYPFFFCCLPGLSFWTCKTTGRLNSRLLKKGMGGYKSSKLIITLSLGLMIKKFFLQGNM